MADALVLGSVDAGAKILHVAAEAGEVFREAEALAAGRANAVGVVVDRGNADQRGQEGSDFVTQIAARLERIADRGQRTISVEVSVEGILIEGDLVVAERVAAAETPIFGDREAHADRAAGADLRVSGVALVADEVEASIVTAEQVSADQD